MALDMSASIEPFSDLSLGLKIVAVVTYFMTACIGAPLLVGIAQFEKYGGDPQKRLLDNQLVSFLMSIDCAATSVNGFIISLRTFIGPVGNFVATIFLLHKEFIIGSSQSALTMLMLFKCLSIFNWRLASQLNEDFMSRFLSMLGAMIGLCCVAIVFALGTYQDESYFVMAGVPGYALSWNNGRILHVDLVLVSAVVNSILTSIFVTKRALERRKHRALSPGGDQPAVVPEANNFNTIQGNEEVYDLGTVGVMIVCLVVCVFLFWYGIDKDNYAESYLFANYVVVGYAGLIVPGAFYFKNASLRNWIKRELHVI